MAVDARGWLGWVFAVLAALAVFAMPGAQAQTAVAARQVAIHSAGHMTVVPASGIHLTSDWLPACSADCPCCRGNDSARTMAVLPGAVAPLSPRLLSAFPITIARALEGMAANPAVPPPRA